MIKYYPIEQDLYVHLKKVDLLPGLLLDSEFALKTVSSRRAGRDSIIDEEKISEEKILKKIDNAETLEEIQLLQKLLSSKTQTKKKHLQNPHQGSSVTFSAQKHQWLLPWLNLFQNKLTFFYMFENPRSLQLAHIMAQRRPNTLFAVYQYSLINVISEYSRRELLRQDKDRLHREKIEKGYKLRGNKNVGLKKSLDYGKSATTTKSNQSGRGKFGNIKELSLEQRIAEFKMAKRILELYKRSGLEGETYDQLKADLNAFQQKLLLAE